MTTFRCRFCQGERPHNGQVCLGCGAAIARARDTSAPKPRLKCPRCKSPKVTHRHDDSFLCDNCGTWFEPDDEPLDNRPDVAAQKRERLKRS